MNSVSDQSNTDPDQSVDTIVARFQSAADSYIYNIKDKPKASFLKNCFRSIVETVRKKTSLSRIAGISCSWQEGDIDGIAARHLFRDWKQDLSQGIKCLDEAISHLNKESIIIIPTINAAKIIIKHTRRQAVTIDSTRWASYAKLAAIYDYFLYKYNIKDDEEELAYAAIFAMIVNGCHFHKSYLSIIDATRGDFDAVQSWIMLIKQYQQRKDRRQVKNRFFLSAVPIILILRLIKPSAGRIQPENDKIFPQSFHSPDYKAAVFRKRFNSWLGKLVSAYNAQKTMVGDNGQSTGIINSFNIVELYQGAQIWTGLRFPFITTSYLRQSVVPGKLSPVNYRALFTTEPVGYTEPCGSKKIESWLTYQPSSLLESDQEISEDTYLKLMNVHSAVTNCLKQCEWSSDKEKRSNIAAQIQQLAESLPYPTSISDGKGYGYLLNYRLLVDWLAVMIQTKKAKAETTISYFSDLANMLFFILADTSILSLDKDELSDVVFEITHAHASPRTQRTTKNKIKQFLSFLGSRYRMPELDWSDPEFWIIDEPMEREIMGFSEFDQVIEEIETIENADHADRLKAVMILLFWAGLRIHEAALMSHDAVYIDLELNIFIKKSKTRAGKRSIPLHYLLPEKELQFFRHYVLKMRAKGAGIGAPLFSLDGLSFPEPQELADMITSVISDALRRHITCHQLRHSFASWLMVRWYVLVYGTVALNRPDFSDSARRVLLDQELKKLGTLFLGEGPEKCGDDHFMHAIMVISRILGHAGPETTVNVYIHSIDVISKLFAADKDAKSFLSIPRAAKIMGVSYPTVAKFAGDESKVSLATMRQYSVDPGSTCPLKIPLTIIN